MAALQKLLRLYPLLAFLLAIASSTQLCAQARQRTQSSSSGTTWAMQAMAALTGGVQVNSVTESGSVTRTVSSDQEQGNITLQSSGIMNSEMDISTGAGVRSEIRTMTGSYPDGVWIGLDGTHHSMLLHNCWSDAVWFFPALSLLADYADPNLVFDDLGQEQYGGSSVEHIRVYRTASGLNQDDAQRLARLSRVHYYLDSQTAVPIALAFNTHADNDMAIDIQVAVVFSDYRAATGILTPFQITTSFNGTPMLQIAISSASPNNLVQRH
jgi:hypothetical protein